MKFRFFAVTFFFILLISFSFFSFRPCRALDVNVLAITSFDIVPDKEESLYFGSGFADSIITKLSGIEGLHLIEREQLERAKKRLGLGQDEKITQEVAFKLGELVKADIIILGTIQTSRDRFKIATKTLNLKTKEVETFTSEPVYMDEGIEGVEKDLEPFNELQEQIAMEITSVAGVELTDEDVKAVSKDYTLSGTAYVNYARGRDFYVNYTAGDNDKAIEFFEKAVHIDPDYALAYAGLGDAYAQKVGAYKSNDMTFLEKSIEAGKKAISIDPELPEGYKSLGLALTYKGFLEGDEDALSEAMDNYEKALEFRPYYLEAHLNMARIYLFEGKTDKAFKKCEKAIEIDFGYSLAHTHMAYVYIAEDEYGKAIEEFEKVIDIETAMGNNNGTVILNAYVNSGVCYERLGKFSTSMEHYNKALEIDSSYPPLHFDLGVLYVRQDENDRAREELELYLQLDPDGEFAGMAKDLLDNLE